MSSHAVEALFILEPDNNEAVYITARKDYRTERELISKVQEYFTAEHRFVRKLILEDGISKSKAEIGKKLASEMYASLGRKILKRGG